MIEVPVYTNPDTLYHVGSPDAKKILFLDDSDARIDEFLAMHSEHNVRVVKTADKAIEALHQTKENGDAFDIVCLDHDLGGEVFVDSNRKDCGMEVVRWMVEHKPSVNEFIWVHSWNLPAARIMDFKLRDAGYHVDRSTFYPTRKIA